MKLIIDIPEKLYRANVNGLEANEIWDLRVAVANGIPVYKIKAEIEEVQGSAFITYEEYEGLRAALEIINKYTEEGEDKA